MKKELTDRVGRVMVLVPAGPFLFGVERRIEIIDYNFYIDKYPVTNEDFWRFVEKTAFIPKESPATFTSGRRQPPNPTTPWRA